MLHAQSASEELGWYIGDPSPHMDEEVIVVCADGDELLYVENRFTNLRRVKGAQVTRWFGDDAKFILANLVD